jgi:hypothetical protein
MYSQLFGDQNTSSLTHCYLRVWTPRQLYPATFFRTSLFLSYSVFPLISLVFPPFCFFFYRPFALHFFLSEVRGFHGVGYQNCVLSAVSIFCDVMSCSVILNRNVEAAGSSETLVPVYETTGIIPQAATTIFLFFVLLSHHLFLITRIPVFMPLAMFCQMLCSVASDEEWQNGDMNDKVQCVRRQQSYSLSCHCKPDKLLGR